MSAKLFIEFHQRRSNGVILPALGSDGFQQIDARFGIERATEEANLRAWQLRQVQPDYVGFVLKRGATLSAAKRITAYKELAHVR